MELLIIFLSALGILLIFARRYYLSEKGVSILRVVFPKLRLRRRKKHVDTSHIKPRENAEEQKPEEQSDAVAKMPRSSQANLLFRDAMEVYNQGELDNAAKMFIQVTAIDNHFHEARHKLGLIYLKQGQFSKAEVLYNQLIVATEPEAVYHSNLGRALYEQAKFEDALKSYMKALDLDSTRAGRFVSIAEVYRQLENKEKAQEMYKKAIEIEPNNIEYLLTFAHFLQDDNKKEQAKNILKKALELDPENNLAKEMMKD